MHQTFSDNLQQGHLAEALAETRNTPTALGTERTGVDLISLPRFRKVLASGQRLMEDPLLWQRVILIQDGKDKGFTQAPIRSEAGSVRAHSVEQYKGHVLDVLIETSRTERIGKIVHNILRDCYPNRSEVPALDTLHYTLGEFPHDLVWNQGKAPEQTLDTDVSVVEETILSDTDKLDWIKKEDTTIIVFLPLPRTDRAKSRESAAAQLTTRKQPGNDDTRQIVKKTPHTTLQQLQKPTQPPSQPSEPTQRRWAKTLNNLETPPSGHQMFVRVPDTWSEKGRKPAYIQTMPTPTSLDTLKEGLGKFLSIHTHAFRIQYGGKTLTYYSSLGAQGVTKGTTVWMMVGGLFGGADTEMGDIPPLASSAATPTHRPTQTHSQETQSSIDEWINRLRISNPLTQDLATVNMLMTVLNLTKDQATTAITEALNEEDEDKDTDISRFQQVQEAFLENFEQFLYTNDIAFPVQHGDWEAFSNSFKEHMAGIARHLEF